MFGHCNQHVCIIISRRKTLNFRSRLMYKWKQHLCSELNSAHFWAQKDAAPLNKYKHRISKKRLSKIIVFKFSEQSLHPNSTAISISSSWKMKENQVWKNNRNREMQTFSSFWKKKKITFYAMHSTFTYSNVIIEINSDKKSYLMNEMYENLKRIDEKRIACLKMGWASQMLNGITHAVS